MSHLSKQDEDDDEPRVLFVRHWPSILNLDDRKELLHFMGASYVKCFEDKGPLRNSAFATFEIHSTAKHALQSLHQMKIGDRRLTVEYAKPAHRAHFPSEEEATPVQPAATFSTTKEDSTGLQRGVNLRREVMSWTDSVLAFASRWGLNQPITRGDLAYAYPAPTRCIITNMARALAASPRFYTQALHLMNKLHLPAPFGPDVHFPGSVELTSTNQDAAPTDQEMDVSSGEESEIASDDSSPRQQAGVKRHAATRRTSHLPRPKRTCAPPIPILSSLPSDIIAGGVAEASLEEVFEQASSAGHQATEIRLQLPDHSCLSWSRDALERETAEAEVGGFGRLEKVTPVVIVEASGDKTIMETISQDMGSIIPSSSIPAISNAKRKQELEKEEVDEESDGPQPPSDVITECELSAGLLSPAERALLPVFRNYVAGEPSCRLYVKNLARGVTSVDLERIFARFVDWSSLGNERALFSVRLLTEGRMKGQAFVSLANEEAATRACLLTNGYLLMDRPMVVQFARGAKAQIDPKSLIVTKDS